MTGRRPEEHSIWYRAMIIMTAGTEHIENIGRGEGQSDSIRGTAVATARDESARSRKGSEALWNAPHTNMNDKDRYRRGSIDDLTSTYPGFL